MKKNTQIIVGFIIAIAILLLSDLFNDLVIINTTFLPSVFVKQTSMLILSIIVIIILKEYVNFKISFPKPKQIIKPILFGLVGFFIAAFTNTILTKVLGGNNIENMHPVMAKMNPYKIFLFVFIYASVVEEIFFRGFLLNILSPLKEKGIRVFKRKISIPIIISALAFGLVHLTLLKAGSSLEFTLSIVISATFVGLAAGYYQEKYNNHALAIITHMSANSLGVIAAFVMQLNM